MIADSSRPQPAVLVYQLDPSVSPPRHVAAQLVVDPSDPERPYTLTFHLRLEELDLAGLIHAGAADLLHAPDGVAPPRPAARSLVLVK